LVGLKDGTDLQERLEALLTAGPEIDLEALADAVYALMKEELWRERQRLGNRNLRFK
jgi:hypothetical protein